MMMINRTVYDPTSFLVSFLDEQRDYVYYYWFKRGLAAYTQCFFLHFFAVAVYCVCREKNSTPNNYDKKINAFGQPAGTAFDWSHDVVLIDLIWFVRIRTKHETVFLTMDP